MSRYFSRYFCREQNPCKERRHEAFQINPQFLASPDIHFQLLRPNSSNDAPCALVRAHAVCLCVVHNVLRCSVARERIDRDLRLNESGANNRHVQALVVRLSAECVEKAVQRVPEILECHLMSGQFDYLLRVVARDAEDYERIHRTRLARLPGVQRIQSSLALRNVKALSGFPIE